MNTFSKNEILQMRIMETWFRSKCINSGPQHSYWDICFDLVNLQGGRDTLMNGTPREVFENISEIFHTEKTTAYKRSEPEDDPFKGFVIDD